MSEPKEFRLLKKVLSYAYLGLMATAALCCAICMVLITADVVGRYFFSYPIPGTLELNEIFLVFMIFGPLAYLGVRDEHIRIEILSSRFPVNVRKLFDTLMSVLGFFFFGIMTWQIFLSALFSWHLNETTWGYVSVPLYIPKFFIVVGCFFFSLHFLIKFLEMLLNLFRSETK